MNKPKLILFDFGGVLIDYSQSFQTASKEQNIPIEFLDNSFDTNHEDITVGKITPEDIYQIALTESNMEIGDDYNFTDSWVRDYQTIQPTYEFLEELSHNYVVGILSNTYKGIIKRSIELNRIPNVKYKYIFQSCELGYQKPEIDIYKYVEDRTGLKGKDILFIDDREDYIDSAKQLNWNTFLFDNSNPITSVAQIKDTYKLK
jgi:putative hydrolase of the HAD superfamily